MRKYPSEKQSHVHIKKIQNKIKSGKLNVKSPVTQETTDQKKKKKKVRNNLLREKSMTRKFMIQDACQGVCRVNKPWKSEGRDKKLGIKGKILYSLTSVSVAGDLSHSHTRTFPHRRLIRKCVCNWSVIRRGFSTTQRNEQ